MAWKAMGATSTGMETGDPRTVVSVETDDTSMRTLGRRRKRENASRFQRSVRSSPAPPVM